ncbi:COX15/CtaA family protein [Sediminibacterium sp.]|uniref:COX15/CtaA family protein n=1 Tax=Sediminibacterium sp. TaxID=1917865 RepID=UPI00271D7028|nr:COX15/CtaA family protein [Sediminibacterium sp.]MDO9155741.1 COX15/CtaA family protein [Sediminibacterium sp.]MDP2420483.1 COX15/CtaA family protein [Sediminibacterium sp.]
MLAKDRSNRQVAFWLLIGVGMTIIQIALGGITRLTGSGLSITQWEVITGTLPPLNEAAWLAEFAKYKQTPQFQLLNFEFQLDDFKFIFFWEWFHRLWARLIGLVFAFGFIWFIIKKSFKKDMIGSLLVLFFLGALQGLVGWIMVASGLTGDAVYVKPTRLALHFILALGLLSYTYWFALKLLVPANQIVENNPIRKQNLLLIGLLILQLIYGALMAGHKAANVASTWPTINGAWLPDNLFSHQPFLLNFIDNTILIHFIHRGLAYLILVLMIFWSIKLFKSTNTPTLQGAAKFPLLFTLLQVVLGIASVLTSSTIVPGIWGSFEWMAQLHQLTGMLLLLSLVTILFLVRPKIC